MQSVSDKYDELTEWRRSQCILYDLTTASNERGRKNYLEPLVISIKQIFGGITQEEGGLTEDQLWVLDNIIELDDTKFLSLKYTLFFFSLVHIPPFLEYIRTIPPIANKEYFDSFVTNHLPLLCEKFLGQNFDNEITIGEKLTYEAIKDFDRKTRSMLLKIMGPPLHNDISNVIEKREMEFETRLNKI